MFSCGAGIQLGLRMLWDWSFWFNNPTQAKKLKRVLVIWSMVSFACLAAFWGGKIQTNKTTPYFSYLHFFFFLLFDQLVFAYAVLKSEPNRVQKAFPPIVLPICQDTEHPQKYNPCIKLLHSLCWSIRENIF